MGPQELEIWLNHFEYHAAHPRCLPQGLADPLSADEVRLIGRSIATFQLGEQSDGHAFLRAAQQFSKTKPLPRLVSIIDMLVREEQRHAALVLTFMRDHRIERKSGDWTDRVFRRVRRLAGLHFYLSVLISAEFVGIIYYRALESVTNCERLRVLCRIIVADELAHVGFESQLLLSLRMESRSLRRVLTRIAHGLFFVVTAMVVWFTHRSVLLRAGHSARSFLGCCVAQYSFYLGPAVAGAPTRSALDKTAC